MDWWIAVCGAGVVIASVAGCNSSDQSRQKPVATQSSAVLGKCARIMRVSFPGSTRVLNVHDEATGPDAALYLKITLAPADLDKLLGGSPFAGVSLRSDRRFVTDYPALPWWTPEAAVTYRSGQAALSGAEFLDILIQLDQTNERVVYLMWHKT
jgi:hypothetical protein